MNPEWNDLCSTEGIVDPSKQKEPAPLPFDDFRWWITPASGSASVALNKIESEAFTEMVTGGLPSPVQDYSSLLEFRKAIQRPVVTYTPPKASDVMQKTASEHKRTVASILSEFKKRLGGPEGREGWDRLQRSCEKFVQQALAEAT
jgi:hypothetical protein